MKSAAVRNLKSLREIGLMRAAGRLVNSKVLKTSTVGTTTCRRRLMSQSRL